MYENSVTADGAAWTYRGATSKTTDRRVVTTQCAPLAGSSITQASADTPPPLPFATSAVASARCAIGCTVLSGGVTFAHLDNTEGAGGVVELWTSEGGVGVSGLAYGGSRLTARAQCVPPGSC